MPAAFPDSLPASLLPDLLAVSLTGVNILRPCYDAAGQLIDFAIEYLNPAAQRMTGLAEQPGGTLLTRFPSAVATGILAYYQRVYEAGDTSVYEVNYQADNLDNYFQLAARRSGEQLVVSFTDTADQDRSSVEQALRESQVRERATQAEAEHHRLAQMLGRMSASIALLSGPEHRYTYINPEYERLFPGRPVLGRTLREVIPEISGQGFYELFDRVYETGTPYYEPEAEVWADFAGTGQAQRRYYRTSFEPLRNAQGHITEILNFAVDVTTQVESRQQVEQLNQELESRVRARTQEAEAARAEAERQRGELQRILAQAPVAMAILRGPELVIELANDAMGRLWGRPASALVGRPHFEALPDTAGQGFEEQLLEVLRTGQPLTLTEAPLHLGRGADGQGLGLVYINTLFQRLVAEPGAMPALIAIGVDVTEQVRARQQIEQLNQALEARVQERTQQAQAAQAEAERQRGELERIFEQAPLAIAVYRGPTYTIELANATVARLWGRTREQLLGKGLFEALPEVAGMGYEELLDEVMATGVPHVAHAMEAQHDRNGQRETVYWDFVYVPMHAADGRINGAMVVATEVTAQVRARQQVEQLNQELESRVQERTHELAEQQALLGRILGQVPAAIATLSGPAHHFTFANDFYRDLVGGRDVLGQPVAEALPEVVRQGFIGLLDNVYQTGEPFIGQEVPIDLRDHTTASLRQRYLNFVYQPMPAGEQHDAAILVFAVDVTEQVQARQLIEHGQGQVQALNQELQSANEELHQSNTQLTRTNTDLDTFVYTASHDLKAPITNIEGILEALRETLPPTLQQDAVVAQLLDMLSTNVSRFLITITQLTDIAYLQRTYDAPAERLALAPLVADVLADLAPQIGAAAARVQVAVPADLHISFAPASLRSIVYNLLSNAVKYRAAERPSQVVLRAERQPGTVVLTVQDNGLGLSEPQQKRLFGIFQRLHTHVEGTGVGLYMIKRLIENAGATITVTSSLGVGTTFAVTFPA